MISSQPYSHGHSHYYPAKGERKKEKKKEKTVAVIQSYEPEEIIILELTKKRFLNPIVSRKIIDFSEKPHWFGQMFARERR